MSLFVVFVLIVFLCMMCIELKNLMLLLFGLCLNFMVFVINDLFFVSILLIVWRWNGVCDKMNGRVDLG